MVWFSYLKKEGYFNPENNPPAIKTKDGIFVPYWKSLSYLEKLSAQIAQGNHHDLITDLLNIIKFTSEKDNGNYRTWHSFIQILGDLPNDKIPLEIFDLIPIWLTDNFDNNLQSSELCEKILPKFLTDNPTKDDVEKAEKILFHLLSIKKAETKENSAWSQVDYSYKSNVYLHWLKSQLIEKRLVSRIAKHCSNEILFLLTDNLRKIILTSKYGAGIKLTKKDKEYNVRFLYADGSLTVVTHTEGDIDNIKKSEIKNYEKLNTKTFQDTIEKILKKHAIQYDKNENNGNELKKLHSLLDIDFSHTWLDSVEKLGTIYSSESLHETFALILRELLLSICENDPDEALKIIKAFASNKKFRFSFFKKFWLFVLYKMPNKQFLQTFWSKSDKNLKSLFFDYNIEDELYDFLKNNLKHFNALEKKRLLKIIESDNIPVQNFNPSHIDYWKLRWYSALRNDALFKKGYLKLSIQLNMSSDNYEKVPGSTFVGEATPYSSEEILSKQNSEIIKLIIAFKPTNNFNEPSIIGFAESIGKAVEEQPIQFCTQIELYKDVYYVYASNIIDGFEKAWKQKKPFDWEKVLSFCYTYLTSANFGTDKLKLETDFRRYNEDSIFRAMADLITEGVKVDDSAFDPDLLPIAKKILLKLTSLLNYDNDEKINSDYVTHILNSTSGKVLRALLDYSLRKARVEAELNDNISWDIDVKNYFNSTAANGVIDKFVLFGMYLYQFLYLDDEWTRRQITKISKIEDKYWYAFIGGLDYTNPPNKEFYGILLPHYERAVKTQDLNRNGIIRHIVAFYISDYENLEGNSLTLKLINSKNLNNINNFIAFLRQNAKIIKTVPNEKQVLMSEKVLALWQHIVDTFKDIKNQDVEKTISNSISLFSFMIKLNKKLVDLLVAIIPQMEDSIYQHNFVEKLNEMKDIGDVKFNANSIGRIINELSFNNNIYGTDQINLTKLVEFLYINDEKTIADKFCNKLSYNGHEFIKNVYRKYNP